MAFTNNIKHPITFSRYRGTTDLQSEIAAINQSIRLILTTAQGELYGDPNFGSRLHEYLFEYTGEALYQLIRDEIVRCLTKQEPRISIIQNDIKITQENSTVYIDIKYTIRNTDYQVVYPHTVQVDKEAI